MINIKQMVSGVIAIALWLAVYSTAIAEVNYEFCVIGDRATGDVKVTSAIVNLGKDWYEVKAATEFCTLSNSHGCTASDFDPKKCGKYQQYSFKYDWTNLDQVDVIMAAVGTGNVPVALGSVVEAGIEIPAQVGATAGGAVVKGVTAAGKGVAAGANTVGKGVATGAKAVGSAAKKAACTVTFWRKCH